MFIAVSITETLLLPKLVIYANGSAPAELTSPIIVATETNLYNITFFMYHVFFPIFQRYSLSKKIRRCSILYRIFINLLFSIVALLPFDIIPTNICYNHKIFYFPTHPVIFDSKFL